MTDQQKRIKDGTDKQFILDKLVKCKCGKNAIWFRQGYLCPSITAYPCKYN